MSVESAIVMDLMADVSKVSEVMAMRRIYRRGLEVVDDDIEIVRKSLSVLSFGVAVCSQYLAR
jgi:hypothetical protein